MVMIFVSSANILAYAVLRQFGIEERLYRLRKTKDRECCPVGLRILVRLHWTMRH